MKILIFSLLFSLQVKAKWNGGVDAGYRSLPAGLNASATLAHDNLLWGEYNKTEPLYGYSRVGLSLGGSPTAAAFVQLAPIAPLIFELQKSASYRYIKSSTFDCEKFYCYGNVDRTEMTVTLLGGYDKFVALASYMWREIRVPDSSNQVVAELEYFTLPANQTHTYHEVNLILGYNINEEQSVALAYTSSSVSYRDFKADSIYALYRMKYMQVDLTFGAGTYNSDQPDVAGNGVVFAIGKKFGESLSLF